MTDPKITPPPELREQWREEAPRYRDGGVGREHWLMDRAAQWAYEQRRPKPPRLADPALAALGWPLDSGDFRTIDSTKHRTINAALMYLKKLEDSNA